MIAGGGPEEDWGCAGPDELFITSGPTPSLWSLVQRIESREQLRRIGGKLDPVEAGGLPEAKMEPDEEEEAVTVAVPDPEKSAREEKTMTTTVAKGNGTGTLRGPNLRKVAFEVEKFVAANLADRDERQSAEQRLVISLGAKPPRRKAMNYRKLKEERAEAKRKTQEESEGQGILRGVREGRVGKMKKRKGKMMRKRKNGSGVVKKAKREGRKNGGGRKK